MRFREYRNGDWKQVARDLRQSDMDECGLIYPDYKPHYLLEYSVNHSDTLRSFIHEDKVLAVCGVALLEFGPSVWLLGAAELDKMSSRKAILRQAPKLIDEWVKYYNYLWNVCSDEAIRVRMLRHLGFRVSEVDEFGKRLLEIGSKN